MAYTALYREWRPKTFDDVVGQEHITVTLKNQIKKNRIAHAYLLCGTRGTGKTSTAKIMAKAVNCLNLQDGEPCNECEMCKKINAGISMDVVELDAASNNGVDKIRDIIDDVQYPPQEGRYKVYIMDEVHMLSQGAVNAFLKTLEEPPERVIFILATTDPQKLPITVLSRCQKYDFRRIKSEDIFGRLRKIVTEKGVFADDNSLKLISRVSDGAMRDSLSILDQAISMGNGKVDYNMVVSMLGLVTNESLFKLTDAVLDKNIENSMKIVDDIVYSGKDLSYFIKDMINHMRNLMMVKVTKNPEEIMDMSLENIKMVKQQSERIRIEEIMRNIRILQEAEELSRKSIQSRIYLELAIIKMCKIQFDNSNETILLRLNKLEEACKNGEVMVHHEKVISGKSINRVPKEDNRQKVISKPLEEPNPNSSLTLETVRGAWKDILETFKGKRMMIIYASLVTGEPVKCEGGIIYVKFESDYASCKQRLEKAENSENVDEIFSLVLKEPIRVKYLVDKKQDEAMDTEQILVETFGKDIVEVIDE